MKITIQYVILYTCLLFKEDLKMLASKRDQI